MVKKKTLITDVDNTLFDWVEIWHASFSEMLSKVAEMTGVTYEELYPQIKSIHQAHGTSEYAYLLEELPALKILNEDVRREVILEGNRSFSEARSRTAKLYPGVLEALRHLRRQNVKIVAFTESFSVYTACRFQACGLDGIVDVLYSPEKHHISSSEYAALSHSHEEDHILHDTEIRHTPAGVTKPNADLLRSIVAEVGSSVDECVYVGDSLMKDIAMAQILGVTDAHAAYGHAQHREEYSLLKLVTHWPDAVVQKESETNSGGVVVPTHKLKESFAEILDLFSES